MTSIIKNQLVKHLSKFTKNLKPEQISLDVLKGNSKLDFIEINEDILTEILELPRWLRIKRAFCTGVTVNVPWTKLNTSPIQIFIDEISVDVELTSETTRSPKLHISISNEATSYGFINKIIENMSLYINTVEINFESDMFGGSFMLQRLSLESRSPGWAQIKDLKQSRLKCSISNRTLLFKQISWNLLRIEASAKTSKDEKRSKINAPLRFITSGGKIRIALKKNSHDGTVVHARIQTILDDILWVATLPQLRSAISFTNYIVNLMRKCRSEASTTTPVDEILPPQTKFEGSHEQIPVSSSYKNFDFLQTSYHLHVKKIDLHLCDDAHSTNDYPTNWNIESGAMQVTLTQFLIDLYPKSNAFSNRSTWVRYPNPSPISEWIQNSLLEQLNDLLSKTEDVALKSRLERCWPHVIGFFVVIRTYDITIQCVSDMNTKKDALSNLFESERHLHSLPHDQEIVHIELAVFQHPLTDKLEVPKPIIYGQFGPFTMFFDERTIRWCCYVVNSLQSAIDDNCSSNNESDNEDHILKINLIMPRIVLNAPSSTIKCRFPLRFVISMSNLFLSSSIEGLNAFERSRIFAETGYRESEDTISCLKKAKRKYVVKTSPVWIETDNGSHTKGLPLLHDVSFIGVVSLDDDRSSKQINFSIAPTDDICIVVDHFQFIRLIRLQENFKEFFDLLTLDLKHYNANTQSSPTDVNFSIVVPIVRIHVILTTEERPYLYHAGYSVDNLSDMIDTKLTTGSQDGQVKTSFGNVDMIKKDESLAKFPEFPIIGIDTESSTLDENSSINTSIEDEGSYDYEDMIIVDREENFDTPDLAEEAIVVEERAKNDKIYRCVMSEMINLFVIQLENIELAGKIKMNNLTIDGRIKQISFNEQLAIERKEVNSIMRSKIDTKTDLTDWVSTFVLEAPADDRVLYAKIEVNHLNATISNEVLSYLSAFVNDEDAPRSTVRLVVHVHNSNIHIVDSKKSKPFRLKIKSLSIEQEED